MKTLGEFIVEKQQDFSHATGELTALLSAIKLGAKIIHRDINKAGLVDILGTNGISNVQGEVQMKLDLYANEKLKAALKARGEVAGIASEEEDDIVVFEGGRAENAKYVVLMDPLDGSSNIDVNVSVGTIFSIYHFTIYQDKLCIRIGRTVVTFSTSVIRLFTILRRKSAFNKHITMIARRISYP